LRLATSKCGTESTCSRLFLNHRLPPPMGWFGRTADVPPQDLAKSDLMRSVDPLLSPQPLSPSRTRTRTQLTKQPTRTQHNKDSTKVRQDPNTIPTPTPAPVSRQQPGSPQLPRHSPRRPPPRAQTLDTHWHDKGNRSGPRPPNPGESCA
jgi:hypothetical protein